MTYLEKQRSAHAELVEASFVMGPFDKLRVSGIQYVIVFMVGSTKTSTLPTSPRR
jgi:hypothetical protein